MDMLRRLVLSIFVIFFMFFSFNLLFLNVSCAGAEVNPGEQLQDEAINIGREQLQPDEEKRDEVSAAERVELESSDTLLAEQGAEAQEDTAGDMMEGDRQVEQATEAEEPFVEEDPFAKDEEVLKIADPLSPWNKAMYHFNDKFFLWVLKPVSKGYSKVLPEDIRTAFGNFFQNLLTPVRFVNNLLQLKIKDAGNELVRVVVNTTVGVGGLADVAKDDMKIPAKKEDFGQTLGSYGIGHGFYLVWPFIGPSSLRDTFGFLGDRFLDPVTYVNPMEAAIGIKAFDVVNETSFVYEEYEKLKKDAYDPYLFFRDAYVHHRDKKVNE